MVNVLTYQEVILGTVLNKTNLADCSQEHNILNTQYTNNIKGQIKNTNLPKSSVICYFYTKSDSNNELNFNFSQQA